MAKSAAPKLPVNKSKEPRDAMNNMYRLTRHVYDASRKFYLLGRDHLIKNLNAKPNEDIIEVGCGTARNLIIMSYKYPQSNFYGIDASDEMLKTAESSLVRLQLSEKVPLIQGLAQTFSSKELMKKDKAPDKIIFSYVLSMIPDSNGAIEHALKMLPVGGEIHIVDFCHLKKQPALLRKALKKWLSLFHVRYDPALLAYIKKTSDDKRVELKLKSLYNDYAYYAVLKKI